MIALSVKLKVYQFHTELMNSTAINIFLSFIFFQPMAISHELSHDFQSRHIYIWCFYEIQLKQITLNELNIQTVYCQKNVSDVKQTFILDEPFFLVLGVNNSEILHFIIITPGPTKVES